jgi:hypothetical protein
MQISEFPLSHNFPEYSGDESLTSALKFIESSFKNRLPEGKTVQISAVSARWKRDIKSAFDDVKKCVYDANRSQLLAEAGRINRQRKALLIKQSEKGDLQSNARRREKGEIAGVQQDGLKIRRVSAEGEDGVLQSCWKDWKTCWSGCCTADVAGGAETEAQTVFVGAKGEGD